MRRGGRGSFWRVRRGRGGSSGGGLERDVSMGMDGRGLGWGGRGGGVLGLRREGNRIW